jgi:hypothetical protein
MHVPLTHLQIATLEIHLADTPVLTRLAAKTSGGDRIRSTYIIYHRCRCCSTFGLCEAISPHLCCPVNNPLSDDTTKSYMKERNLKIPGQSINNFTYAAIHEAHALNPIP